MSRLAILVVTVTLSTLTRSGESFVSTIASTTTIPKPNECYQRSIHGATSSTRRQQQQQQQQQLPTQEQYLPFSSSTVTSITSYRRSSSLLKAALLTDPGSSGRRKRGRGRNSNDAADKKAGWHRRIFGKIPWRRQKSSVSSSSSISSRSSSTPLRMIDDSSTSIEQEEPQAFLESFAVYQHAHQDSDSDFVARNFDTLVPESVLPVVQVDQEKKMPSSSKSSSSSIAVDIKEHMPTSKPPTTVDSEYFDVSIIPAMSTTIGTATTGTTEDASSIASTSTSTSTSTTTTTKKNSKSGLPSAPKLLCRLLENILTERIGHRWSTESPEGLTVDVRPSLDNYNNLGRLLLRGQLRADATLSSGRIIFPVIRFSSVRLEMEQVTLNLMGFFFNNNNEDNNRNDNQGQHQRQQKQKHQRPLTKDQQRKRRSNTASSSTSTSTTATGTVRYPKQFDLHIEDLTMSRHDLLFSPCIKNGLRQLLINVLKDRGVRSNSIKITSIDILSNGKISIIGEAKTHKHFRNAPVHFEVRSGISSTNRGHVLTFPGLEVSLNRNIGLFVPVHPTLDLDVGHNTIFRSIVIDSNQKLLKIAASVTITPDRTRLVQDYVQTSDAFSAIFFYDVGQWLTRLGRFSK